MSTRRAARALADAVRVCAAPDARASPGGNLGVRSFTSIARVPSPALGAVGWSAARVVRHTAVLAPQTQASVLQWHRGKKKKAGKAAASVRDDGEGGDEKRSHEHSESAIVEYDESEIESAMECALESLERDLGKLRVGRASPGMLESLVVDAYGEPTMLQHLGSVAARDAQTLAVLLYDPLLKGAVTKAITESPLGFMPRDDGDTLLVPVPEMTKETKKEVAKMAHRFGENAKISVRNARKRGMDGIKKAGMPEDEKKRTEKALQKIHDDFVKKAGELATAKEKTITG